MIAKPYTYLIKFKPTGQYYYGSRVKNVKLNRLPADDLMVKYFTSSDYIQNLINEFGLENFEWEVRREFDSIKEASEWETKVLKRCKVLESDKWLNRNIAGYIPPTVESVKKISDFHKGKPKTESHKQKISASLTGKVRSKEHSNNLSKSLTGKMSGEKNPMYGKPYDPIRAERIGDANRGKVRTDEFKNNLREHMLTLGDKNPGKNKSEDTKRKLKEARAKQVMKPRSEESKQRTAAALKAYHAKKRQQNENK